MNQLLDNIQIPVSVQIFSSHKCEFYTSFKPRPSCSVCTAGWRVCQVSDHPQSCLLPGARTLSLLCDVLLEKIRSSFPDNFPVWMLLIGSLWQHVPFFCISFNLLVRQSYVLWYGSHEWLLDVWHWELELKVCLNWDVQLSLWLTSLLDNADPETWLRLGWNFLERLFHRPGVSSRRTAVWLSLCDLSSHWQLRARFVHLQNSNSLILPFFLY